MRFDILTLFPGMFIGPMTESILKRAQAASLITIEQHDIRDYATDKHRTCDDAPYGGGAGMVMKAVPLAAAIRAVLDQDELTGEHDNEQAVRRPTKPLVLLMTPDGEPFTQRIAEEFTHYDQLLLVCGHYEGVDERIRETLIDREISIGDYVLTGGELAAMVVIDAVARLLPGVLDAESTLEESHSDSLLEYPHYTRPASWEGREVPPVLLSGNHGEVAKWRRQQRLRRTLMRRPDLLERAELSKTDQTFLESLRREMRESSQD